MSGPLEGIRVLDLTRILTGPFATMRLGDMGAEVIKVELPGKGDDTRGYGPPFTNGESVYFLSINRNKRSITLNLKSEKGKEVLWRLIERCDVVIENFRPGTLEELGFSYEGMRQTNPRIIYCAISGYGQTGLRRRDPSYDLIVQAESGLMDITGHPDGPPTKAGISLADVAGGLAAAEGILLALFRRERTGVGQKIDISLLDSLLPLFTYQTGIYFATGKSPQRRGNRHPTITPYESFEAKDGHFILAIASESLWHSFCQKMKEEVQGSDHSRVEELLAERFSTNALRVQNREELRSILDSMFCVRTTEEWLTMLTSAGIPCGGINKVSEICDSALLKEREMVLEVQHPLAGPIKMIGLPIKLSESPGSVRLPPPTLGEHTEEVLLSLGYSPGEISQMRAQEVI